AIDGIDQHQRVAARQKLLQQRDTTDAGLDLLGSGGQLAEALDDRRAEAVVPAQDVAHARHDDPAHATFTATLSSPSCTAIGITARPGAPGSSSARLPDRTSYAQLCHGQTRIGPVRRPPPSERSSTGQASRTAYSSPSMLASSTSVPSTSIVAVVPGGTSSTPPAVMNTGRLRCSICSSWGDSGGACATTRSNPGRWARSA